MAVRCLRCGTMLNEVSQFCEDCRQEMPPEPGVYQPTPAKPWVEPSAEATTSLAVGCPNCGNTATPGDTFCSVCGITLDAKAKVEYAGFWIRLAAWFVDGMVLILVNLLIILVFADTATIIALQFLSGIVYTIGFWTVLGATPGKLALGMRILTVDGGEIGFGQAFLRYFGYFVNGLTLGIGYLMIGFSDKKRGLHDLIAGTVVVQQ